MQQWNKVYHDGQSEVVQSEIHCIWFNVSLVDIQLRTYLEVG